MSTATIPRRFKLESDNGMVREYRHTEKGWEARVTFQGQTSNWTSFDATEEDVTALYKETHS